MAAASTFSYAQAAKSASSPQTSQATGQPIPADSSTLLDDASATDSVRPSNADKLDWDSIVGSESDIRSESVPRQSDGQKEDRALGRLERPWRRADRESVTSGTTSKSADDQDSRKPRKGKKKSDKPGDDKEVEEQPKVELSEAPIPSVNIWQQRREAQAHAVKTKPETPAEEVKKPAKPADQAAGSAPAIVNGAKFVRKTDNRNGARGSRVAEKEARDAKAALPPSVSDSTLWPTPETVVQEDKKTVKTEQQQQQQQLPQLPQQQTTPKEAQDDSAPKPRSKEKWVAYDYVPTVSFETQIPQMRSSKPRGGARNVNGAARNSQPGEKAPAATTQQAKPENRNRRESTNGSRTASQPPSKRGSMDVAQVREQRKTANAEKAKEAASNTNTPRERPEGRSDRGRGGFRGRGGHHATNSHSQHQHNAPAFNNANGPVAGRAQGPYSPPPRGGHGQMYMPPPQRGRGGRNAAANYHRMSLPNGATRLPPVQTQFSAYEYPLPPMSAVPFQPQPYWDNMMVPVLKNQIEYYFSIENLCKDMYLRARMDTQGFVPLHFIAAFKRVRELSAEPGMLRAVCEMSQEIDLVVGEDEIERVRRREGWESFVLPLEDRDDLARNHGPTQLSFKNRPYMGHQFQPMPYGMMSPPAYQSHDGQFQPFDHGMNGMNGMNGAAVNGANGHKGSASQLSAAVPDFSPSGAAPPKSPAVNGHAGETESKPNGVHAE